MHGGQAVIVVLAALGLTTGCSLLRTEYPPAYPAPRWDPTKPFVFTKAPPAQSFCPPPVRRVANPHGVPSAEEWQGQWKLKTVSQRVCRGTGKQRRCRTEPSTAVDTANKQAVQRATPWHTKQGMSGRVRFAFDPREEPVYEILTSPWEFTYLLLFDGERQATQMPLNEKKWEVLYSKSGEEGSRQEVLIIRPIVQDDGSLPPPARVILIYQNGWKKHLLFKPQERPGMLSVEWFIPEEHKKPVPPPVDQQPPAFQGEHTYAGYTITLEGKKKYPPPWLPAAVVDDGTNTLIKFTTAFEGVRLPIVSGVQQNGQPALVQSRLYVRPGHGTSWIWVQGLWPALRLKDAAGLTVKVVRQVPKPGQELPHEDLKVSQVDDASQYGDTRRGGERRPGDVPNLDPDGGSASRRAERPDPDDGPNRLTRTGWTGDRQRHGRHEHHDVFTVYMELGT